jgi:hypothetical protein
MKYLICILTFFTLIMFQAKAGVIQEFSRAKPATESTDKTLSSNAENFGFREFGIETALSYGPSPVYDLIIRSDGTIVYNGYDKSEKLGRYEGFAGMKFFSQLAQYANEFKLMKLEDSYESKEVTTCTSPNYIYLNLNGKKKIIRDGGDLPSSLWAFRCLLSSLESTGGLKKMSEESPLNRKLNRIYLKHVSVTETDLTAFFKRLSQESREADQEKKGMTFKLDASVPPIKALTFENITLGDLLTKITQFYKLDYEMQNDTIVIKAKKSERK